MVSTGATGLSSLEHEVMVVTVRPQMTMASTGGRMAACIHIKFFFIVSVILGLIISFDKKVLRPRGVEVAEVGVVIDTHMRAKGVLGAVEVEVAIGAVGIFGGVAAPEEEHVLPHIGHLQHAR